LAQVHLPRTLWPMRPPELSSAFTAWFAFTTCFPFTSWLPFTTWFPFASRFPFTAWLSLTTRRTIAFVSLILQHSLLVLILRSVAILVIRRLLLSTIIPIIHNLELGAVVLGPALRHWHGNGLVVPRRDHRAHTVDTSGQTVCNDGLEKTLPVARVVDTLEERERDRIGRRSRRHTAHILDRNVAMANDVAFSVQVLRRSVIVGRWISEESGAEVLRLDFDVERRVGGHFDADLGTGDDGCDHVGARGDFAHGDAVAGSTLDLQAVGEFLALAEIDEVRFVARREG
jgi:hypothetical protein